MKINKAVEHEKKILEQKVALQEEALEVKTK